MARERGGAKYAYGICTNTDHDGNGNPCPKCASKERLRVNLRDEFVCPECGEQLTKVNGGDPPTINWKLIGGIAAAVVLLGGGLGWFFGIHQPAQREAERQAFAADSLRQDSIAKAQKAEADKKAREEALAREEAEAQARINDSIEAANKAKEETKEEPKGPKPKNPPYGSYSGPRDGSGNPHGVGGEVRITRSYSLDLKKSPAEYVQLGSGDKIVNTKFINGQLKQGEIVFADGRRKWINL